MKNHVLPAVRLTLVCLVFFCGLYTMAVWAAAQLTPHKGEGFTIARTGKSYAVNVAQAFTEDRYFWPRPSAVDYDAAESGGSNYGPANPVHIDEVKQRIAFFLKRNPGVSVGDIPSDLVTASGSGLDPHISVPGAEVQAKRVAQARNLPEEALLQLIDKHIEKPLLGLFGTSRVNVLLLNLALDDLTE